MTSALDTRDGVGYVSSRIGMKRLLLRLRRRRISLAISETYKKNLTVLVDEAQFLKRHHVYDLARVVDEVRHTRHGFGLKRLSQ